jgi:hypothetical protein
LCANSHSNRRWQIFGKKQLTFSYSATSSTTTLANNTSSTTLTSSASSASSRDFYKKEFAIARLIPSTVIVEILHPTTAQFSNAA